MGSSEMKLKECSARELTTYLRWHLDKRRALKKKTHVRSVRRRVDALARLHIVKFGSEMYTEVKESVRKVRSLAIQFTCRVKLTLNDRWLTRAGICSWSLIYRPEEKNPLLSVWTTSTTFSTNYGQVSSSTPFRKVFEFDSIFCSCSQHTREPGQVQLWEADQKPL